MAVFCFYSRFTRGNSLYSKPQIYDAVVISINNPCATRMTDIDKTKEMLAGLNLTDKEIEEVRDACDFLAEVIVDGFFEKLKQKNNERRTKK